MTTIPTSSGELSCVAAHYERLRQAALGGALPPDARAGLLLFLRRGMWAWTQALTAPDPGPPLTISRAVNEKTPGPYATVVPLLAALAIHTRQKGVAP